MSLARTAGQTSNPPPADGVVPTAAREEDGEVVAAVLGAVAAVLGEAAAAVLSEAGGVVTGRAVVLGGAGGVVSGLAEVRSGAGGVVSGLAEVVSGAAGEDPEGVTHGRAAGEFGDDPIDAPEVGGVAPGVCSDAARLRPDEPAELPEVQPVRMSTHSSEYSRTRTGDRRRLRVIGTMPSLSASFDRAR